MEMRRIHYWMIRCTVLIIIMRGCDNHITEHFTLLHAPFPHSLPLSVFHNTPHASPARSTLQRICPLLAIRGGSGIAQSLNDEACRLVALGGETNMHRAEDTFRRALGLEPTNSLALCNYGRLLQRQDRDLDLAGDMMAKAVRLKPEAAIFASYALFLEEGVHNTDRAQEVYEKAILLHPSDTILLHNFAHLLRCRAKAGGEWGKGHQEADADSVRSKHLFERVLSLQPSAAESVSGLGCLFLDMQQYAPARKMLEQALRLLPNNPSSCCNLAMLDFTQGLHESAASLYRRALALNPSHEIALCNLSDLSRRHRETRAGAYTMLRRVLAQSPRNTHAIASLAQMLAEDGKKKDALDLLYDALDRTPADVTLATTYALLLQRASMPQGGGEGKGGSRPEGREGVGHQLTSALLSKNASASGASDREVSPDEQAEEEMEEEERLSVAPAAVPRADLEKASEALRRALAAATTATTGLGTDRGALSNSNTLAYTLLARIQRDCGVKDPNLGRVLKEAAARKTADPAAAAALARALLALPLCDGEAALATVEDALLLHPDDPTLLAVEAVALAQGGYEDAGEALEAALTVNPSDVSLLASYGLWLKGERDWEGAEAMYKAALRIKPGDATILVNFGMLVQEWQGDWDMAHTWYKRALAVDPGNQHALLERGRIFEDELLDLDAAQDFYTQAGSRGSDRTLAAEGLWRAGLIQWKNFNKTAKAYELLSRAVHAHPAHAEALHALAALEAQCGDIDDAVGLYQDAIKVAPANADTIGELADLYQSRGQIDESESAYLAVLALRPTDVDAMKGYAHLLKRHRAQAGVAAQLYEAAAALERERKLQDELEDEKFNKLQELLENDNQTVPVLLSEHDESGREIRSENVPFHGFEVLMQQTEAHARQIRRARP